MRLARLASIPPGGLLLTAAWAGVALDRIAASLGFLDPVVQNLACVPPGPVLLVTLFCWGHVSVALLLPLRHSKGFPSRTLSRIYRPNEPAPSRWSRHKSAPSTNPFPDSGCRPHSLHWTLAPGQRQLVQLRVGGSPAGLGRMGFFSKESYKVVDETSPCFLPGNQGTTSRHRKSGTHQG